MGLSYPRHTLGKVSLSDHRTYMLFSVRNVI